MLIDRFRLVDLSEKIDSEIKVARQSLDTANESSQNAVSYLFYYRLALCKVYKKYYDLSLSCEKSPEVEEIRNILANKIACESCKTFGFLGFDE